ncbi:hypothetical protein [Borrelia persica]|uniref:hypothetical protein n=1 Tax=Borrelia persica TaxID=44448 RepID=UPI0004B2D430|nr:hypothetical protein [Borrelia persica]
MSEDVQSKQVDETIINFPVLVPEDFDYDYVYAVYVYVKKWVAKKYTDNLNIILNKVDGGLFF